MRNTNAISSCCSETRAYWALLLPALGPSEGQLWTLSHWAQGFVDSEVESQSFGFLLAQDSYAGFTEKEVWNTHHHTVDQKRQHFSLLVD